MGLTLLVALLVVAHCEATTNPPIMSRSISPVSVELQGVPVPAFFWSGSRSVFSGQNVQVLDTTDIKPFLERIVTGNVHPVTRNYFTTETSPEVAILFLHDKLRTDQVTRLSFAYEKKTPVNAFAHLQERAENSPSSLVIPYSYRTVSLGDDVTTLALRLLEQSQKSQVVLVYGNDPIQQAYAPLALNSRFKTVEHSKLQNYLETNSELFNNGAVDFFIVCLDASSVERDHTNTPDNTLSAKLATDDLFLGTIDQTLRRLAEPSHGNYVALLTGAVPMPSTAMDLFEVSPDARSRTLYTAEATVVQASSLASGNSSTTTTDQRIHMTDRVLAQILVFLFIAIIVFSMCNSLGSLQGPKKFESQFTRRATAQ